MLQRAIALKTASRGSNLLDDPSGTGVDAQRASELFADLGPGLDEVVANLQQFEADTDAQRLQLRTQTTLDALNGLAHYLQNFPGHKNLIWFSGSFPINLLPDPSLANGFTTLQVNQQELRETTDPSDRAQVAVFPVDARGVQTEPMYDAAASGRRYSASPTNLGKDLSRFSAGQENEHATMDLLAEGTGGHAYYGTNGLAQAVADAVESGSSYYTLTYTPTNSHPHGELRTLRVALTGAAAAAGLQLSYRRSYYAQSTPGASAGSTPSDPSARPDTTPAYTRVALSHGSPNPQDILFQASVTRELPRLRLHRRTSWLRELRRRDPFASSPSTTPRCPATSTLRCSRMAAASQPSAFARWSSTRKVSRSTRSRRRCASICLPKPTSA